MGKAEAILKETSKVNAANFHNNVYWYFMKKKGFGFCGSESIFLNEYDESDEDNEEKISWIIQGNIGYNRIKTKPKYNFLLFNYYFPKVIYQYNSFVFPAPFFWKTSP